jgi:hypothetical protein
MDSRNLRCRSFNGPGICSNRIFSVVCMIVSGVRISWAKVDSMWFWLSLDRGVREVAPAPFSPRSLEFRMMDHPTNEAAKRIKEAIKGDPEAIPAMEAAAPRNKATGRRSPGSGSILVAAIQISKQSDAPSSTG